MISTILKLKAIAEVSGNISYFLPVINDNFQLVEKTGKKYTCNGR